MAELFTTLIFFPDAFVQDKGDLIHHVFGVVGLLIMCVPTECNCNVPTAFTTLCTVLTATTLFTGVWEEGHTSVSAGVYCTDHGAFHIVSWIAIFPWHWRLFAFSVQTEDATLSVVSVVILFSLDISNFYWFYSMIHI